MGLKLTIKIVIDPTPAEYARCAGLVLRTAWHMWRRLTLPRNMAKRGWHGKSPSFFLEEVDGKLRGRIVGQLSGLLDAHLLSSHDRVMAEAADVQNLVAMFADLRD